MPAARDGYEFQRLHGMGEALYHALLAELPELTCRVYAPVGGHADLLAYLVRRLLENGANSSFVSVAADPSVPIETVLRRPQSWIGDAGQARHPHIPLPRDLFAPARRNSAGVEFGDRAALDALLAEIRAAPPNVSAAPLIDGVALAGRERDVLSPIDGDSHRHRAGGRRGDRRGGDGGGAGGLSGVGRDAGRRARRGARARRRPDRAQARPPDRAAAERGRQDARRLRLGSARGGRFLPLLRGAGARAALAPQPLPGPTGESNELRYRGRGVFVCISPWNFPLAIFTGQVAARARRRQCAWWPSPPSRRR